MSGTKSPASDRRPVPGPKGPRTPYPVDEPVDPNAPGSEPDVIPGIAEKPTPRL